MTKGYYINGIGCVSTQDTTNPEMDFLQFSELRTSPAFVSKPVYKNYIKPAMIRRMSTGVKAGVVAAAIALEEAGVERPGAIITGTGMGCLADSEKFLEGIINNNEQFLTPTSFIQSTHNTVGAQIALGLNCKAYNVTYVHRSTSFESALLDAMMMVDEGEQQVLCGGVDEIGKQSTEFHRLVGDVKNDDELENGLLNSGTKGAVFAEGAQFFVINNEKSANTYAELVDVKIYDRLGIDQLENKLRTFLENNRLKTSDIDLVVLGKNGDVEFDNFYDTLQAGVFADTQQIYYKHFSGEYHTATAFGMWTASKILRDQSIPGNLKLNDKPVKTLKNILLYNQYQGMNHSFTLLRRC